MLYPQIISHCIDDDEIRFWSSDVGIRYWIVCLVYCYLCLDMLYPQIFSHCFDDDDMMSFDYESVFRSSVGCLMLWVVRLVSVKKLTL